MIITVEGDVLSHDGIIVHGCNAHGVMGAGIAAQVKKQYPGAFEAYLKDLTLGNITTYKVSDTKFIVNAITQQSTGFGKQVSYDAIESCFQKVNKLALKLNEELDIEKSEIQRLPVSFPLIGAGLGGGNWKIIERIIDETLDDSLFKVLYIYG